MMDNKPFDPNNISIEEIFRAKEARRKRLANLPFKEKIKIVERLQTVARTIRKSQEDQMNGANEKSKR
jgi:hypothetical protein